MSRSRRVADRDPRPALAAAYAANFGHLGIVLPFLAPWLLARGFEPAWIGVSLALPPLFKVVTPWTWAAWADGSGRRRELLLLAAAVAALALAGMTLPTGRPLLWLCLATYAFAVAPILPYLEATSLEQTEARRFAYGVVRLWGSVAFIVCAGGFGWLAHRIPADGGLWLAATLLAGCAVAAPRLPAPRHRRADDAAASVRPAAGRMHGFFAACALMQASHGAYYTFYSIRLEALGYDATAIGALWALAVVCEVLLLTRLDRIVDRLGSLAVLRVALLVAALRWMLVGSTASWAWLALGQSLHAVTYAAFHVAAVRVVHGSYEPDRRIRGQALYSGMTFGIGLFAGNVMAGLLAGSLGFATLFRGSALLALAAIPLLGMRARRRRTV